MDNGLNITRNGERCEIGIPEAGIIEFFNGLGQRYCGNILAFGSAATYLCNMESGTFAIVKATRDGDSSHLRVSCANEGYIKIGYIQHFVCEVFVPNRFSHRIGFHLYGNCQ